MTKEEHGESGKSLNVRQMIRKEDAIKTRPKGAEKYKNEKELLMKTTFLAVATVLLSLCVLSFGNAVSAEQRGTAKEAEALVKKAVSYIKANGKEKAFAEFGKKPGQFVDRDLYIFVYDLNGKCLAHGQNPKMVGNDLIDMKDPDGKLFVKERVEIAKTKGKGWQNYKFTDPISKKVEEKSAYIEKYEDIIVGSGIYKK